MPPLTYNVRPIYERMINDDCRCALVGDSISINETQTHFSWFYGLIRNLRPMRWVGAEFGHGSNASPDSAGLDHAINTVSGAYTTSYVTAGTAWASGSVKINPAQGNAIVGTATAATASDAQFVWNHTMSGSAGIFKPRYGSGDWYESNAVTARAIYSIEALSETATTVRGRKNNSTVNTSSRNCNLATASGGSVTWNTYGGSGVASFEIACGSGAGSPGIVWSPGAAGVVGSQNYFIGGKFFRPSVSGLYLFSPSNGGWAVADHAGDGKVTAAVLKDWYAANDKPNVCIWMIGQNDSTFDSTWKSNLHAALNRHTTAANLTGQTCYHLLVSQYQPVTTYAITKYQAIAQLMYEVACERNDAGYVNAFDYVGGAMKSINSAYQSAAGGTDPHLSLAGSDWLAQSVIRLLEDGSSSRSRIWMLNRARVPMAVRA